MNKAIQIRLDLIGSERGIPKKEVNEAKRNFSEFLSFAERYDLSIDWLVRGNLNGLQRMTRRLNA